MNRKEELIEIIATQKEKGVAIVLVTKEAREVAEQAIKEYVSTKMVTELEPDGVYCRFSNQVVEIGVETCVFQSACSIYPPTKFSGSMGKVREDYELNHSTGSGDNINDDYITRMIMLGAIAQEYKLKDLFVDYKLFDIIDEHQKIVKELEDSHRELGLFELERELKQIELKEK